MHAYLGDWLLWFVLAHVASAFAFVLVHGPSVYALVGLRREHEPARIGALLDLSQSAVGASWTSFGALALTGLVLAVVEHTWRAPWVWGSALLLAALALSMSLLAARPFNHAREALGLPWFDGKRQRARTGIVDPEALARAMASIRARAPWVIASGALGLAALVALMVMRPG